MRKVIISMMLVISVVMGASFLSFANAAYAHLYSDHTETARVIVYSGSYSVYANATVYSGSNGTGTQLDSETISKQNGNSATYTYTATASHSSAASGRYDCRATNNSYSADHFSVSGVN